MYWFKTISIFFLKNGQIFKTQKLRTNWHLSQVTCMLYIYIYVIIVLFYIINHVCIGTVYSYTPTCNVEIFVTRVIVHKKYSYCMTTQLHRCDSPVTVSRGSYITNNCSYLLTTTENLVLIVKKISFFVGNYSV